MNVSIKIKHELESRLNRPVDLAPEVSIQTNDNCIRLPKYLRIPYFTLVADLQTIQHIFVIPHHKEAIF